MPLSNIMILVLVTAIEVIFIRLGIKHEAELLITELCSFISEERGPICGEECDFTAGGGFFRTSIRCIFCHMCFISPCVHAYASVCV